MSISLLSDYRKARSSRGLRTLGPRSLPLHKFTTSYEAPYRDRNKKWVQDSHHRTSHGAVTRALAEAADAEGVPEDGESPTKKKA